MKSLKSLLNQIDYENIHGSGDRNFSSISYDSRLCGEESLFVALRGENFDAHNFIENVVAAGCKIIVCEELPEEQFDATFIKVQSSRKALAQISKFWFDDPSKDLNIIGVTGTNGKTTITFILSQILADAGKNVAIIGTTGIYFAGRKIDATHTTPESYELCKILSEMKKASVDTIVMEVSSHSLSQYRVAGIKFNAAIFSNLTHDHMDYHKTYDNYAKAKKILFDSLDEKGIAVVNGDDCYADFMIDGAKCKSFKVGRTSENDYQIQDELLSLDGNKFSLCHADKKIDYTMSLLGKFNIDNAALSSVLAEKLGISPDIIIDSLAKAKGADGRMSAIRLNTGALGVVDYSHTPDALEKALKSCREIILASYFPQSKLICVFGCGGDRDKTKRPVMGDISSRFADITIVTDDNPRTEQPTDIRKDILAGIDFDMMDCVYEVPGRAEAIQYAVDISNENDIILVAGKGHEKYQIIGKNKLHFDDIEELQR